MSTRHDDADPCTLTFHVEDAHSIFRERAPIKNLRPRKVIEDYATRAHHSHKTQPPTHPSSTSIIYPTMFIARSLLSSRPPPPSRCPSLLVMIRCYQGKVDLDHYPQDDALAASQDGGKYCTQTFNKISQKVGIYVCVCVLFCLLCVCCSM